MDIQYSGLVDFSPLIYQAGRVPQQPQPWLRKQDNFQGQLLYGQQTMLEPLNQAHFLLMTDDQAEPAVNIIA